MGVSQYPVTGYVVQGLVHADGKSHNRIILPFYKIRGTDCFINSKVQPELTEFSIDYTGKEYGPGGKTHRVFKQYIDGAECYFIEGDEFIIEKDGNEKPKGPYSYSGLYQEEKHLSEYRRWAYLCSHAENLITQWGESEATQVDLIQVHDAQTALLPGLIKKRHSDEWEAGKTPATHLTIHNVICPLYFNWDVPKRVLGEIGIFDSSIHTALLDGIEHSDGKNTVSPQFSKELQTTPFGKNNEIDNRRTYKIEALKGSFTGILNGATIGWDPATHPQLKNWKQLQLISDNTLLNRTTSINFTGHTMDLTYHANLTEYPQKLMAIREQLCLYLKKYGKATFDPKKPIFFYIGRYCVGQKGVDKLQMVADAALGAGAQFIAVGPKPEAEDEEATKIISELQNFAGRCNNTGICIIADEKRSDGRWHYQQGNTDKGDSPADQTGIPGFDALLRGGADYAFFLSKFEPCGLVQLESHQMCTPTVVTDTGGFHDTVFEEGDVKNGYRIPLHANWYSAEQATSIIEMVDKVSKESQGMLNDLYSGEKYRIDNAVHQRRRLGYHAMQASWAQTEDGSPSPIEYYKRAWEQTFAAKNNRGTVRANLHLLNPEEKQVT